MDRRKGRTGFQNIPRERRIVLDVIRWARHVPHFAVERQVKLKALANLRNQYNQSAAATGSTSSNAEPAVYGVPRLSWATLFLKAFGLVLRADPQLRQSYHSFPWPRLYQSNDVVISLTVCRQEDGQPNLYFGKILSPDQMSLVEIQLNLNHYQNQVPEIAFGQQFRAAALPQFFRDLLWWWRLNGNVAKRAVRVGTAGMSTLAGQGVLNRSHPCLLTSSLSYGPVDDRGNCLITLICDHRVLDGVQAAESLNQLCHHLRLTVASEIEGLLDQGYDQRACA